MFGAFRFILASLVVLTHCGMIFDGFRLGPMSVVSFYIISGFVISALLDNSKATVSLSGFYAERAFRIYPQFAACLVISVAFLLITGHVSSLTQVRPDIGSVLMNASLFPLQFRAISSELSGMLYVPTSWSLSLEASFYLVAPLLMRSRGQDAIAGVSFLIFALAVLDLLPGRPHTLSYAMLPGTLHFFVLGAWLQRGQTGKVVLWAAAMVVLAVLITTFAAWRPAHVQEVMAGGLLGAGAVWALRRVQLPRLQTMDDWLGRISYPVFLNHFLFIWAFDLAGYATLGPREWLIVLLASWGLGAVTYLAIEHPTHAFRRSLRRR